MLAVTLCGSIAGCGLPRVGEVAPSETPSRLVLGHLADSDSAPSEEGNGGAEAEDDGDDTLLIVGGVVVGLAIVAGVIAIVVVRTQNGDRIVSDPSLGRIDL